MTLLNLAHPSCHRWLCLLTLLTLGSAGTGAQTAEDPWDPVLEQAASLPRLYSLLVSRNGELLQEHYYNGKDADDIANVKSVSKSIISALVGIAVDRDLITGIDQPIGGFFPDELGADSAKNQITIGNLLSMQSGLETTSNRNYGAWVLSDNWIRFALQQPYYDRPDGRMIYSTGNTHLLGAIVSRASGMNTLSFARHYLFGPMDMYLAVWPTDPQGNYFGGNDMELTPRQMLAFGELYINNGRFKDQQIIAADWVEKSLQAQVASPRGRGRHYGYGWWIRDTAGFETPYAWGYGGQFILLVPEEKLVVVLTSNSNPGDSRRYHTRAAHRLVEDAVAAATQTDTSNIITLRK